MPAFCSSSAACFSMKRPLLSCPSTLRRATPPSLAFFPALSSTWIAALVSSKLTLAAFAAIPHCCKAADMAGSSADPACPAAAMTFIIRAISSLARVGSSRLTPYWFMAVVSTWAAATPSPPISLLVVWMQSPIARSTSGYLPSSGLNCDNRSLYPSTATLASVPNALALSRAKPSICFRVSPVTPATALRSCIWLSS